MYIIEFIEKIQASPVLAGILDISEVLFSHRHNYFDRLFPFTSPVVLKIYRL